ncbi:MAG: type II toxin-antitoxin system YafQ family toxin [Oscillospiraceae bacterium]|nr:type II toxin-antitoxin system YafQ family toxin [Oscillospiraceae bacterium]
MKKKYEIKPTASYKRELKKICKQHKNLSLLNAVIEKLANGEPLPELNRDHELTGNFKGCRECHIQPNWLLIYEIQDDELILYLLHTGSHSELFGK